MKLSNNNSLLGCGRNLVNRSERLVSVSSFVILHAPLATASLLMWYDILCCFLLSWDSGVYAFLYTDLLSQKMSIDLSMGTPNILSLYRNAAISSTEFFIAVRSDPNINVSTQFCLLLCHIIGALLQNISFPVMDLLVVLSHAWLASTKQWVNTDLHLGLGISKGIGSQEPG